MNKKSSEFNIIKNDPTAGHGGFGAGSFTLDNMSPVIIDVEAKEAYVDMGAMHARSKVERRIKFLPDRDAVPNGKRYWLVWVTVERGKHGPYYAGVAGCEMVIDQDIRRGYKNFPEHVNNMDKSRKGRIVVQHMDDKSKRILRDFLKDFDEGMWERSSDELKDGLSTDQKA
mgnify:CR=1 FL=1